MQKKLEYIGINGLAWTKQEIQIAEVIEGELAVNDQISVYFLGGYIPLEEHNKYFKDDEKIFNHLSKKEIKNTIIKSIVDEEKDPIIDGKERVYFLVETRNSNLTRGAYERVCGKYSVFDISKDKQKLIRNEEELEASEKEFTYKYVKNKVNNKSKKK